MQLGRLNRWLKFLESNLVANMVLRKLRINNRSARQLKIRNFADTSEACQNSNPVSIIYTQRFPARVHGRGEDLFRVEHSRAFEFQFEHRGIRSSWQWFEGVPCLFFRWTIAKTDSTHFELHSCIGIRRWTFGRERERVKDTRDDIMEKRSSTLWIENAISGNAVNWYGHLGRIITTVQVHYSSLTLKRYFWKLNLLNGFI